MIYFKVMFAFTPIFQSRLFVGLHITLKHIYRSPSLRLTFVITFDERVQINITLCLVLMEAIKGSVASVQDKYPKNEGIMYLRDVGKHLEGYRHLFEQTP
jgi:hypothetical protein